MPKRTRDLVQRMTALMALGRHPNTLSLERWGLDVIWIAELYFPGAIGRVRSAAEPRNNAETEIRNYPEQPPLIPHSIEGYQIDLNSSVCLVMPAPAPANLERRPVAQHRMYYQ
jgi:hypothetical protein